VVVDAAATDAPAVEKAKPGRKPAAEKVTAAEDEALF
jgi:hypothetical protein